MEELKQKQIWLLWKFVLKNGKETKVPISAINGKFIGTTSKYASHWTTFEKAVSNKDKFNANGLGFIVPKGYFFFDIDDQNINEPLVKTMLDRFDTYTEYSQSGNGIHGYGKCDLSKLPIDDIKSKSKYYMKNSKLNMELYIGGCTNRFAVFTGNAIKDIPLNDCTDAILETLNNEMLKSNDDKKVSEIIESLKSQKSHKKFEDLFNGEFNKYFKSLSEADLSLCTLIAYRTGDNPTLIDEVFRKSKLCRDKWLNREDYRNQTIKKALDLLSGNYHPSLKEHPDFIKFDKNDIPHVSVPLLANHFRNNVSYILVRDHAKSNLLIYLYEDGVYKLYSEDMLIGIIKKFISDYDEELVRLNELKQAVGLILTDLNYIKQVDLNADENIINFTNGILKLDTMELVPHSKDYYSTIQIPCNFTNISIPTPIFDDYINTLTNNDEEIKQLLLEYMGVILSNIKGYRMKKLIILYGESNSAKSQYKALIERLIGSDNFVSIDLTELTQRFATSSLYGKRLAGSSDMSYLSVTDTKTLKHLTGGDSVYAEFKGENAFSFTYNGLLLFCTNKRPKLGANQNDNATYERILFINCPNVIPIEKQDHKLLDKMYEERDGIIYKAISALKRVIDNGYRFDIPSSIIKLRDEYKKENDTIVSFIEECLTLINDNDKLTKLTTSQIYRTYMGWCKDNNNGFYKTRKEFKDELCKYYKVDPKDIVIHNNTGNYYKNITLNPTAYSEYYFS